MDDSCAVCAETLEWVAYGACGHKDVCSTCVARLRFICDDQRCCICKTHSNFVFVTKALGDYTRIIIDFSVFPSQAKEGRVGSYWYHEDAQAYFDDFDHYKMIKAMCKLSCSVCDKMEEHPADGSRRRGSFKNIEQLKGHLFHKHRLLMCSLCLEGRKIFICEQKLYTRTQLNQHISTGDSEVDGSESERGGFTGHPVCEFCRTPFYGDNELYTHMSTEHYTCHICQRQHPGQYEYYKNYDDLEIHFRRDHYLCEDEACLAKKFVVFPSEAEMKRHNTLEHGGRMSRSKRSAALQIPTSFRYRRSSEQDHHRGRGRTFRRDSVDTQLSMAIQASLGTANVDGRSDDPSASSEQVVSDFVETSGIDPIIPPFELLATTDSEPASRYLQAVSQNSGKGPLEESSFPPLPMAPSISHQKPKHAHEGSLKNTMAAHLRRQSKRNVTINSGMAWPAASHGLVTPAISPVHLRPVTNSAAGLSSISGQNKPATDHGPAPNSYSNSVKARPSSVYEPLSAASLNSSRNWGSSSRLSHSTSAPNLAETGFSDPSTSDFPPVSAVQPLKLPASGHATANKSLVERIHAALEFDQDKYAAFKDISGEYRQGLLDADVYLAYVEQFGLSHLVLELARLCPDPRKQKELVDTYNGSIRLKDGNGSKKSTGKSVGAENRSSSKDNLADTIISTVRKQQSSYKPPEEEVEVLSKAGYRAVRGKSKTMVADEPPQAEVDSPSQPFKMKDQNDSLYIGGGSNQPIGDGSGKSKQRKKTSKFHRVRLGDGSMTALLDLKKSDPVSDSKEVELDGYKNPSEGLPVRGVWQNGGGQRLLTKTSGDPKK